MRAWQPIFHRIALYICQHDASYANCAMQTNQQPNTQSLERSDLFPVPIKHIRMFSSMLERKMLPRREVLSSRSPTSGLDSIQSQKDPDDALPEAYSYTGCRPTSRVTCRMNATQPSLCMTTPKETAADLLIRVFTILNSEPHPRYPSGYCLTSSKQPKIVAHSEQTHRLSRISHQRLANSSANLSIIKRPVVSYR